MDEKYRLVFRGEILEGHHKALVKRRLKELIQADESRMEKLFSGSSVVIRQDVDRKTAARYQAQFKQAGGRLRIIAEEGQNLSRQHETAEPSPARNSVGHAAGDDVSFTVELNYQPPPSAPAPEIHAPDFGVAVPGANLIDVVEAPPLVVPEPEFELAEAGVDLLTERAEVEPVEVGSLDFEVAELGADIGVATLEPSMPAPDVSHLQLAER